MTDRPSNNRTSVVRRDRRSGLDRRRVDKGPPSSRDRRVSLEPRQPDVREVEVSLEEWDALQAQAIVGKFAP